MNPGLAPALATRVGGWRHRERRLAVLMMVPALALIALVLLLPILYAGYLSLRSASVTSDGDWVGLTNFAEVFADAEFRTAARNTTVFTTVSVALEFVIGLAMALALHRAINWRGPVRAAVLVPWAFPVVVSALMWRLMLQDQVGVVSWLVRTAGLIDAPILSDQAALMIAVVGVDVWKTTPFVTLVLLAGLQTIPRELGEAAQVDGASAWQRLWVVTLPLLRPAILVALLFRTLEAWSVYDLFWVLSDRQLSSLSTYVYTGVRVRQLDFDQGTAAAVLIFVSSIAIALVFLRLFRSRSDGSGGSSGEERS